MDSVEKVKAICKERKIPISRLERDLGFSNGYIRGLREGKFPSDRLKAISEYLQVPINYLLDTNNEIEKLYGKINNDLSLAELDGVYLSLAREAQQNGISPEDIKLAIETIKRLRGE